MTQYAPRVVGTVRDAWLSQGQAQEMETLSANLTTYGQEGWTLHSIQHVPVLTACSGKTIGYGDPRYL